MVTTAALTLLALVYHNRPRELKHQSVVKVRRVLDGRTVIVSRGIQCYTLRLEAVEAPESYQPGGETAENALTELIEDKSVLVEIATKDSYGRIIATLYVKPKRASKWINVNQWLVEEGHARVHREFYKRLPLEQLGFNLAFSGRPVHQQQ